VHNVIKYEVVIGINIKMRKVVNNKTNKFRWGIVIELLQLRSGAWSSRVKLSPVSSRIPVWFPRDDCLSCQCT